MSCYKVGGTPRRQARCPVGRHRAMDLECGVSVFGGVIRASRRMLIRNAAKRWAWLSRRQPDPSVLATGQTVVERGRSAAGALAAALFLVLAGSLAWAPAASAWAGQAGRSAHTVRVARTARSLLGGGRQRAVRVWPTVSVGNGPDALAVDAETRTLYTSNQNDNTVSMISTATCNTRDARRCDQQVLEIRLPAAASPQGIAVDAGTGTLYVADIGDNTVSAINARTCNAVQHSGCVQIPASVRDPGGPIALAVNQATGTVYAANPGDNLSGKGHTVAVINSAICNRHQHSGCGQIRWAAMCGDHPVRWQQQSQRTPTTAEAEQPATSQPIKDRQTR
jgi:sugar lactone lactonase YvrE